MWVAMGRNLKHAALALLVPLPSIVFYLTFLRHYRHYHHHDHHPAAPAAATADSLFPLWTWCYRHPVLLANVLFFLNVDLLFWLLSLVQSSNWMIDVYWTVIPVLLVHYYANHPASLYSLRRSRVVVLLTWVWSVRLTHNYFRREKWQWGAREDWRFSDMAKQYGKNWWWASFFAVYVSQQVFLIGICLPMYAVHSVNKPWNVYDTVATAICGAGILVAYFADTQLHEFVSRNEKMKETSAAPVPNLDSGLWRYSRHPNYFGEQLWWWGLVVFAWNLDSGWTSCGALVNSMCLAYVTVLVEDRMLKQEHRAEAYRKYQNATSVWIPWFRSSPKEKYKTT